MLAASSEVDQKADREFASFDVEEIVGLLPQFPIKEKNSH